jgi:hypothetical protein
VHGKYRIRTWIRGHSPLVIAERIEKGADCGAHEFYRQDDKLDACYHCVVTRRHEPMSVSAEMLAELERAARAGSRAALDILGVPRRR